MRIFSEVLGDRKDEIEKHLNLIEALEKGAASASPSGVRIGVDHINIVKGGFVVHLYNVVEAVMSQVNDAVVSDAQKHKPSAWRRSLLEEWVRVRINPKKDLDHNTRIERTVKLMEEIADRVALGNVKIENFSGNWSCKEIKQRAISLGCVLDIPEEVSEAASETVFRDAMAPLKYVRHMRNLLAHGNISFLEVLGTSGHSDLERLASAVLDYMTHVCQSFEKYLDSGGYLEVNVA